MGPDNSQSTRAAKRLLVAVCAFVLAIPTAFGLLSYVSSWIPIMMDGPRAGSACEAPNVAPKSRLQIWGGLTIESFARVSTTAPSVVSLRGADGARLWSVCAEPSKNGFEWIEFQDSASFPLLTSRVRGETVSRSRRDTTWWIITRSGRLQEYWYAQ